MKWSILATLFVVFGAADASAQTRTLRWSRLAVTAHLDADGRLRVQERHTIVFNGDWNGGEREFRHSGDREFHLESLGRIDASGGVVPLHGDNSLARVDDYAWTGSSLRWRSRLPSDPPFEQREITYVIDYTYSNILIPTGGLFEIDHNFGLPALAWPIEAYALDLTLDPVWQPLEPIPPRVERPEAPHGEDVILYRHLRHTGVQRPAAVTFGAPSSVRYAWLVLLVGGAGLLGYEFWRRERGTGRFTPLPDPASIDRQWLEAHVFKFPPEVVGAAWDDRTAAPEVAAVIARLAQEGKISSRLEKAVAGDDLVLTLLRPRESFEGYEAVLVDSLFIAGDTTSTSIIKAHYKRQGFDPVWKIRKPLKQLMSTLTGPRRARSKIDWIWTVVLILSGLSLLWLALETTSPANMPVAFLTPFLLFFVYLVSLAGATAYRRHLSNLGVRSIQFVPGILALLAVPANMLLREDAYRVDGIVLGGAVLLSLAFVRSVLNQARNRDAGDRLENRRRLAAARNYFVRELSGPNPALADAWFPYVLAFGLGADSDRWFRSFGGAASSRTTFDSSSGHTSGSAGSSASGWTGFGGGASGGAGASGAWAAAATSMAAGVSSPSSGRSGGSGGGGGGGGGRSGGGGGGGW